jgi:DNA invertase Pin-like site-specific DNA recombinase
MFLHDSGGKMKIGYARVSTDDQTLDLQIDALKVAGCERIYEEHASGKNTNRPQLDICLRSMRQGDTLTVWRLDRLGRSLKNLVHVVSSLEDIGVAFESLTEKLDTSSPTGKFTFHLFSALAEFERNIIRERTNAGLKSARARGRVGGRPQSLTEDEKTMVRLLMANKENSVTSIAKQFKTSTSTIHRIARSASAPPGS